MNRKFNVRDGGKPFKGCESLIVGPNSVKEYPPRQGLGHQS